MSDATYNDDDFVYVDPDARAVVGLVQWDKKGDAVPKEWPRIARPPKEGEDPEKAKGRPLRKPKKRYYPWGSYKTLSKVYRIEKKEKDAESYITLNEAVDKLQEDPY